MRIGNRELNKDESEWAVKNSKDILTQATNLFVSSLNLKASEKDIAGLLNYLWHNPTDVSNEEAEAAEIYAAEVEADEG